MTTPVENSTMVAARIDDAIRVLRTTIEGLELLRRLVAPSTSEVEA
jgi:hypothetical protein